MLKGSILFITGLALCFTCFGQTASGGKQIIERRKRIAALIAKVQQAGPTCAHIIVKQAPAGIDSKSLHDVPKGSEAMPVHKGLQACPEDIR
jgi:hypothetical protein